MAKKHKTRKTLSIIDKTKKHGQFNYSEIFRHIRTNIEYSTIGKDVKSLAITSTQSGEAKTTTALNLAFIYATKYEKVLIIDCDLRKTMLHKYLKLSNKYGLTDALLDYGKSHIYDNSYIQVVNDPSFLGTLSVLTGGVHVPNPSELLGSPYFKEYLNVLKKHYDMIIIDCAPIGMIADAIPVGNAVDGTLFVCSSQDTKRKDAAECVKTLQRNNVNILGSILTKTNETATSHYYYY